jgi:N-acetylmuramoyl-L-alanine amidase
MFRPARLAATLLLLVLAGCATTPKTAPPDVDLTQPVVVIPAPQPWPPPPPEPAPKPAAGPALPAFAVPVETWVHLGRWARSNSAGPLTNLSSTATPAYALTTPAGVFTLQAGSLMARWAGLELRLGFAPQLIGGELFLHTLDLQKNLIPLLRPVPPPAPGPKVIVIDPGHGGHDSGAKSVLKGRAEKFYTLELARQLKPLLEAAGWRVFLTRTNDADLSLPARVAFADACKADVFLSLHFNATTSPLHAGVETYCVTPTGMPSTVTRGFEDDVTLMFPNNHFDAQNLQLALRIHRAILIATGGQDRGVRRARFLTVLRGQARPAVLIEGGYLSNPEEAALIDTPAHRQKLAEAVAGALR